MIADVETQLFYIAGAFDENESTEAEWNELKAALDRCKMLQNKIVEVGEKLSALRTAVNGYSPDTVSEKDKADVEKLAADAKALLASGNLTQSEKAETEALLSTVNAPLEKIEESGDAPIQPRKDPNQSQEPGKKPEEPSTAPKTGDTSSLALWLALLFVSGSAAISTAVISRKKKYNR